MHLGETLLRLCLDFEKCSIPTDFGTSNVLHAKHFLKADPYSINSSRYTKVFNVGKNPHMLKQYFFNHYNAVLLPHFPS